MASEGASIRGAFSFGIRVRIHPYALRVRLHLCGLGVRLLMARASVLHLSEAMS